MMLTPQAMMLTPQAMMLTPQAMMLTSSTKTRRFWFKVILQQQTCSVPPAACALKTIPHPGGV